MDMGTRFVIKNKDVPLALIEVFEDGEVNLLEGPLPGFISSRLADWLNSRTPPKHREHMDRLLKQLGLDSLVSILSYSKGLSLNDTLWVCPHGSNLTWASVNLYTNSFDETIAKIAFDGGVHGVPLSTTSPEFSTNGMLPKCWVRRDEGIFLVKGGTSGCSNTGWEPYCEVMADLVLDKLGYAHVGYHLETFRGKSVSSCKLLTSQKLAMVPSYMLSSFKYFSDFIRFCTRRGWADQLAQYLIFDYLTCNPDRHAGNISVLMDADTFETLGLSPIYDNGMSCLCYIGTSTHWKDYYPTLLPKLYDSFEEGAVWAKSILGNRHNVQKLIGFRFDRRRLGKMPEERIRMVEEFLQYRVQCFLGM